MSETDAPNEDGRFRVRPAEEATGWIQQHNAMVSAELGIPTKAEIEKSDPRVPALMCDPFLKADEFLERTQNAQAIIVVSFASGAMPDCLVPAMQQRLAQGIPIFVLSNNPRNNHGILKVIYAAGSDAYKSGAIGLQKVNVNQHREVKAAILDAIARGLSGDELAKEIEQKYVYKDGEELPRAEWEDPNYVAPPRKSIRQILSEGGFIDEEGRHTPPPEEFQPPKY